MVESTTGLRKRVVLYARVSTQEQVAHGYSLDGQVERLLQHSVTAGYDVVAVETDPGWSGAYLERPGMDRVRELVSLGGVDVVLAHDRDRLSREPEHLATLKKEFAEYGTKLRALNDLGDDTLEGELGQGVMDQLARYQRKKLAQKGNQGKLDKARKGKIIAVNTTTYGYKLSESREHYEVDEERMAIVRRVFSMIGTEGQSIHGVKKTLEGEGVPTPRGGKYWSSKTIRLMILDDVYKPLDATEISALVREGVLSSEVASRLNNGVSYGIWWFNRRRYTRKVVTEAGPGGRREYKKRTKSVERPREE